MLQNLPRWLVEARSGKANTRMPSPHVYANNLEKKNASALRKLFCKGSALLQVLEELEHHMFEVDPLAVSCVKKLIPACCRIGGTMFTSCAFIGWMKGGGLTGHHTDDKNLLTIFISVGGDVKSGGTTIFYLKNPDTGVLEIVLAIEHCDGRWVYAPFSTTLHEGTKWIGQRGVFSAIVSVSVYKFFEIFSTRRKKVGERMIFSDRKEASVREIVATRPPSIVARLSKIKKPWEY